MRNSRVDRLRLLLPFLNRLIREGLKLENDTRSFLSEFQFQLRQQTWGRNRTSSSLSVPLVLNVKQLPALGLGLWC